VKHLDLGVGWFGIGQPPKTQNPAKLKTAICANVQHLYTFANDAPIFFAETVNFLFFSEALIGLSFLSYYSFVNWMTWGLR
jgi:hypothetical protein